MPPARSWTHTVPSSRFKGRERICASGDRVRKTTGDLGLREGAALRRARAAEPRDAPDPDAASPLQCRGRGRPSDPGADGRVPRPRNPFSTPRGTRPRPASRASRLTCGRVGGRRRRPASPSQRPHPSHPPAPAGLRPPPPRSGTLAFLLRVPDMQPAA